MPSYRAEVGKPAWGLYKRGKLVAACRALCIKGAGRKFAKAGYAGVVRRLPDGVVRRLPDERNVVR